MAWHLRGAGIFRLGSASSLSRCRPETEPSSGASPSAATVTYACSSYRQPGLFCCGQRIGPSTASGPGSLALQQNNPGCLYEEHAKVTVAALGDAPEDGS